MSTEWKYYTHNNMVSLWGGGGGGGGGGMDMDMDISRNMMLSCQWIHESIQTCMLPSMFTLFSAHFTPRV